MKIAVAIEKPEKSSPISEVFGRCYYFLIYDQEKKSEEILRNPFSSELGGAGIECARSLIENDVDVVIVKKIGVNPFRLLTSANIKVYQCNEATASGSIRRFTENKLVLIEKITEDLLPGIKRKRCGKNLSNKRFKIIKKEDYEAETGNSN